MNSGPGWVHRKILRQKMPPSYSLRTIIKSGNRLVTTRRLRSTRACKPFCRGKNVSCSQWRPAQARRLSLFRFAGSCGTPDGIEPEIFGNHAFFIFPTGAFSSTIPRIRSLPSSGMHDGRLKTAWPIKAAKSISPSIRQLPRMNAAQVYTENTPRISLTWSSWMSATEGVRRMKVIGGKFLNTFTQLFNWEWLRRRCARIIGTPIAISANRSTPIVWNRGLTTGSLHPIECIAWWQATMPQAGGRAKETWTAMAGKYRMKNTRQEILSESWLCVREPMRLRSIFRILWAKPTGSPRQLFFVSTRNMPMRCERRWTISIPTSFNNFPIMCAV